MKKPHMGTSQSQRWKHKDEKQILRATGVKLISYAVKKWMTADFYAVNWFATEILKQFKW